MVENVKKKSKRKRIRSFALITIMLAFCAAAAVVLIFYGRNRTYLSEAVPNVDGSIETGDNAAAQAMERFADSDPADLIRDGSGEKTRVGLVFVGLTEEADTNHEVLKLLKEQNIKASFALSAAETRDETDFLTDLLADGNELFGNGAAGETNLHAKTAQEMVSVMLKARELMEGAADQAVPYLYCSSTILTGDVLRAAAVSGYEAVLDPSDGNVLDENSFDTKEAAVSYVNSLQGDVIVAVNLRGLVESIQNEDAVTAEKPAIDKQSDLDDSKEEESEKADILTQVGWLLQALKDKNIETEYVSRFSRTEGLTALRAEAEDPDAERAALYKSCLTDRAEAGLSVKGLPASDVMEQTLELLKAQELTVTVFVTPEEAAERKADLERFTEAGCNAGIDLSAEKLEGLDRGEVFDLLYETFKQNANAVSKLVLLDEETEAETRNAVCAAARLLNIRIVLPENPETMTAGALYLLEALDETGLSKLKQQAADAGLTLTDLETVVEKSGSLPTLSAKQISAMRKQNDKQQVSVQSMVYTTERAVSFAFYGMKNGNTVMDAADRLTERGGSGTFFVTLEELTICSTAIEHVLEQGHELGIAYQVSADYPQTFSAVANYLESWKTYASWRYGISADVVLMPSDQAEAETKEAIHAEGCRLVKHTAAVVKSADKDCTPETVSSAMENYAGERVMRGSIISFNMNFYTYDQNAQKGNTVLGAVLDSYLTNHVDTLAYTSPDTGVIEDESRFAVTTVRHILDSKEQYQFCEGTQTDVTLDKNVLTSMATEEEQFQYISDHYIGTSFVTSKNKLPGFTNAEIRKMDTKGRFTSDKVLFLTFDDWGTEQSLNELLYVLDKYNIKATFFVTTQHVDKNPNLLRTIAVHGHQIACHTDEHLPLSDTVEGTTNKAETLTDEEAQKLREDLVNAYNKLYKYTGDVTVDGKAALSRMFRPPTLAVSKIGISQVFDVGYTYSISGDMSTDDYKAESYEDMVDQLKKGITDGGDHISVHDGSVIVMHMLENARYTAQALDTMIPYWKEQGYSFARLDDYLTD